MFRVAYYIMISGAGAPRTSPEVATKAEAEAIYATLTMMEPPLNMGRQALISNVRIQEQHTLWRDVDDA
jgi:hypothetical protein